MKLLQYIIIFLLLYGFGKSNSVLYKRLSDAALLLTKDHVTYDPSYVSLKYPGGDVPKNKGVCTDVVIRAYRKLGLICRKKYTKI